MESPEPEKALAPSITERSVSPLFATTTLFEFCSGKPVSQIAQETSTDEKTVRRRIASDLKIWERHKLQLRDSMQIANVMRMEALIRVVHEAAMSSIRRAGIAAANQANAGRRVGTGVPVKVLGALSDLMKLQSEMMSGQGGLVPREPIGRDASGQSPLVQIAVLAERVRAANPRTMVKESQRVIDASSETLPPSLTVEESP